MFINELFWKEAMAIQYGDIILTWLGHDGFHLSHDETNVYIDPYQINPNSKPSANYLLITHSHYDHLSIPDIEPLVTKDTIIICSKDAEAKLAIFRAKVHPLASHEKYKDDHITVEAVPAYNPDKPFHPLHNGWLGYIVTLGKVRTYHSGDTDIIPEMKKITCNIALLPVSGTYVMNAEEAARAANTIKPDIAIPMHWGALIGTQTDAETFKKQSTCKVLILEREP